MKKRAILYARVSGDDRSKKGRNLAGQLDMGRMYVQERGYTIVAELSEDDRGASGAEIDLPQLNRIREMAIAGEFDVLVVREIDRLSRNLAKQLIVEQELKQAGVTIEYVLGEYPDTPEGDLQKHIKAAIAEYEREKIKERMVRGRRQKVRAGNVLVHGEAPYGYRVTEADGKQTFIINKEEARIVRLVFTWYAEGDDSGEKLGVGAIARRLTEMGVPTWKDTHGKGYKPSGYGEWAAGTVGHMLRNEAYVGRWHYGRRNHATSYNPREHWLMVEVASIISEELWAKVEARRASNKLQAKRNRHYNYLVGRRVYCNRCSCKAHGLTTYSQVTKTEKRPYSYYACAGRAGKVQGIDCDLPYFRADHVDLTVWSWVRELLTNPEATLEGMKKEQAARKEANKPLQERLEVVDNLIADNQAKLDRVLDLYIRGDFAKEMLTERKQRLEEVIGSLELERVDLATQLETVVLTDEQIETIAEFLRTMGKGLKEAKQDFSKRRDLIETLDLRARLAVEDGDKVVHIHCVAGHGTLRLENGTSFTMFFSRCSSTGLRRSWGGICCF